jgi:O-antigen/teichoic acid export membrane protein
MNREFLINLIFLLVINAIIKPLYIFGIDRTIQNVTGQDYGIYFTLLSFTYLFQMLNDFGLQNFNIRTLSMHPHTIGRYFPGILQLKIFLAAIFIALVYTLAYLLGYEAYYFELLGWIVLIQILSSLLLYLRSNMAGLGKYRYDSLFSVLDKLLLIFIVGYFLCTEHLRSAFRIEWFLYIQVASISLVCLAAIVVLRKDLAGLKWKWNYPILVAILKESYPYAIIYILMMIYTRIDAVMIERLLPDGVHESYLYASGYRLLDAANMVTYLFIGLLLPMLTRMIAGKEALQPLFSTGIKLIAISTMMLALPLWFFATPIMELLYIDGSAYTGDIVRMLFIGHALIAMAHILGALMVASGQVASLNIIYIVGIGVNLLLNFILIPHFKALGAAFSTAVTEGIVLAGLLLIVWKFHRGIWTWSLIRRLLGFVLLSILMVYTLHGRFGLSWPYAYLLSIVVVGLAAIISRMLPTRELLQLLRARSE